MDVVLFETAVKLKDVGFPQPVPALGQVWYDKFGEWLLLITNDDGYLCFRDDVNSSRVFDKTEDRLVFAPTATCILREMPDQTLLITHKGAGRGGRFHDEDIFQIWVTEDIENQKCRHVAQSGWPAEACAMAWLEINKKP
jgi:hypothetical protein